MRGNKTRLVVVMILTLALYLSLRWVAFNFEAETEEVTARIEYQSW